LPGREGKVKERSQFFDAETRRRGEKHYAEKNWEK
jgi:hypothetical protein